MRTVATPRRYTLVAIVLHWLIAAMILFNLATGFFHQSVPRVAMAIHISSGITILILSVVRVIWRLTHRPPPFRSDLAPWERALAHLVHFLLYVAMVMMPLTGWAMISASPPPGSQGAQAAQAQAVQAMAKKAEADKAAGEPVAPVAAPAPRKPTMFWWIAPLPKIAALQDMGRTAQGLPAQKAKHDQLEQFHGLGGWILLALLFLHIAGALKHQFVDRHRQFARMGIGEPERVK